MPLTPLPLEPIGASVEPGVTLDRVVFGYKGASVLDGVTLDLPQGASVVVSGANGAGKSTLLYVAAGLLLPPLGTVLMAGRRIDQMLPSERFRRGIRVGFVFQEGGLIANMTALANVALPLRYHSDVLGLSDDDIQDRARRSLARVRFDPSDIHRLPAHLSFGNRKRLALARALALEPNFFYFDDPEFGLDPRTARIIHELLCDLRDDPQVTLFVATNRLQTIDRLSVPTYRLHEGVLYNREEMPESLPPSWPSGPHSRMPHG